MKKKINKNVALLHILNNEKEETLFYFCKEDSHGGEIHIFIYFIKWIHKLKCILGLTF